MLLFNAPYYGETPSGTEFFTGTSATSNLVPDTFNVSINGRPYLIDFNQPFYRQYRRQLAPLIRTQADTSTEPGEQTMDPNSLWRRSFEDSSMGAGQRYLDRPAVSGSSSQIGSVANAFWESKGIDALTTKWQMSLLPDTHQWRTTSGTNLQVMVVGTNIYVVDGIHIYYAVSLGGTLNVVANTPGQTITSACTDGFNVWFACGTDGIYHTTSGSTSNADQWVTSSVVGAVLGYVNGRLMVGYDNAIYNIVAGTGSALPSPLLTFGNDQTSYTINGFAAGNGALYAGVTSGSQSYIYGMTVTTDGTALGAPVIQGEIPTGETITSIYGYLSFLIVGTTLGVRMCTTASDGSVTLGSLISTPQPVECLTGYGRWVWFGYTAYDNVSSGLGKLDLENQVIDNVLPAYCSDLMTDSQNATTSVAIYNGEQIFCVSGLGVFYPSNILVPSGTFTSGYIMYDLTDPKVACLLDVQTLGPLTFGSYAAYLSTDTGAFVPIGVHSAFQQEPVTFPIGPTTGQRFEVQLVLNRDATTESAGPVITRWTLRSYPAPKRPITWQLPLILNEQVTNRSGSSDWYDPLYELQQLEILGSTAQVVDYQEGLNSYPVIVQDVEFLPDYTTENRNNSYFNGIALVNIVSIPPIGAA